MAAVITCVTLAHARSAVLLQRPASSALSFINNVQLITRIFCLLVVGTERLLANNQRLLPQLLRLHQVAQIEMRSLFGILAAETLQRVQSGGLVCFFEIGANRMCDARRRLSIYTSLFLLMTQALVYRILVPGMSNFVNASVRLPNALLYVCFRSKCVYFVGDFVSEAPRTDLA